MRVFHPLSIAALLLAGCTPRYAWENPLDPSSAAPQGQIDPAECNVLAQRAVPRPLHDSNGNSPDNSALGTFANACMRRRGWDLTVDATPPGHVVDLVMKNLVSPAGFEPATS